VDPVNAVGRLVFWLMMLVVILFASSALGLENIRDMFGRMIAFIPTLISGIIIIILGIIIGEFVQGVILASAGGVSGVPTLAKLTKGIMVLIALFMALQQVGVAEEIVTSAFTLILGSVALAAGLAFGLGNRDLAGEITRKWYEAVCGGIDGRRIRRRVPQIRWEALLLVSHLGQGLRLWHYGLTLYFSTTCPTPPSSRRTRYTAPSAPKPASAFPAVVAPSSVDFRPARRRPTPKSNRRGRENAATILSHLLQWRRR
jgi:hypothetical protein